jgi:hypothetical protein
MALLQNRTLNAQYPYRRIGGTATATDAANLRPQMGIRNVSWLSPFVGGLSSTASFPTGWNFGNGWMPAKSNGGVWAANLSNVQINGAGAFTSSIAGGKNASASLAGSGSLTAPLQLVVSLIASLLGSGTITNAGAVAYLQLAASLAGAGNVTGLKQALAGASAALSGSGTVTGSTLRATGTLAANISSAGNVLDSANVGPAVWGSLASLNNIAGTMGEKLNDAGSGSNPWTEVIESGYTAAEILRIITAYAAGAVTGGPASPAFKSLDGTKTRIGGTADADGNRTRSTLDGS